MNATIFCGPSLTSDKYVDFPGFEFRPPARQGDLYLAARERPRIIGIIDGYFDGVPAVWHKEILWALSEGIAVFGASSMGALRAAELHTFGMVGIGQIFKDYRDGLLTDDDEVALLHGPAEANYMPLSVPMVNVRATLERAVTDGVIDSQLAAAIAQAAKRQFYQQRTWQSVVADAQQYAPGDLVKRFDTWLANGRVDQKQTDALELLNAVSCFIEEGAMSSPASFSFEFTETWANAPWRNAAAGKEADREAILDELRLAGKDYTRIRQRALFRVLARDQAGRADIMPDHRDTAGETAAFRLQLGLARRTDLAQWAADNDTGEVRINELMEETAQTTKLAQALDAQLQAEMLDELRLENSYVALRDRARAKARIRMGAAAQVGKTMLPVMLVSWYFGTRLKEEIPEHLASYANDLGLSTLEQFYDLLAVEYAHSQHGAQPDRAGG